jgi:hypothetical protein
VGKKEIHMGIIDGLPGVKSYRDTWGGCVANPGDYLTTQTPDKMHACRLAACKGYSSRDQCVRLSRGTAINLGMSKDDAEKVAQMCPTVDWCSSGGTFATDDDPSSSSIFSNSLVRMGVLSAVAIGTVVYMEHSKNKKN